MPGSRVFLRLPALLGLLLGCASSALAVPVTWSLSGARFTDGGTATGYFVYDADTDTLSAFSVSTAGGNTLKFPPITYDNSTASSSIESQGAGALGTVLTIGALPPVAGQRQIRMPAVSALTDARGTVALDLLSSFQGECYNCNPFRFFNAGSLVGTLAPAITSAPSARFVRDTAGSFLVTASGTPHPSITVTGALPPGISFVDHGDGTAILVGTPLYSGIFTLLITASNGSGLNATQVFVLTVTDTAPAPALSLFGFFAMILLLIASRCRLDAWRKGCG